MGLSVSKSRVVQQMERQSEIRREERKKQMRRQIQRELQSVPWKNHDQDPLKDNIPLIHVQKPKHKKYLSAIHEENIENSEVEQRNQEGRHHNIRGHLSQKYQKELQEERVSQVVFEKQSRNDKNCKEAIELRTKQKKKSFEKSEYQSKNTKENTDEKGSKENKSVLGSWEKSSNKKLKSSNKVNKLRPSIDELQPEKYQIFSDPKQVQNNESGLTIKKDREKMQQSRSMHVLQADPNKKEPKKNEFDNFDWSIPGEENSFENQLRRKQQIPSMNLILSNKFNENISSMNEYDVKKDESKSRNKVMRDILKSTKKENINHGNFAQI